MKLHVDSGGRRLDIDAPPGRHLSESLAEAGIRLDLRCGGNNRCGRCRVRLLSGRFAIAGKAYDADREGPREANACRLIPAGVEGRIEIPDSSLFRDGLRIETGFRCAPSGAASGPGETALAFDIGTTTVAAALVKDGAVLRTAGAPNAQSRFGDNVIDRIVAAGRSPETAAELRRVLVEETLNPLIAELAPASGSVRRIAVAANTVMSHIFCGLSPESIGVSPFRPLRLRFPAEPAANFGLAVDAETPVHVWPAISGSVGGDITGGIAVTGFGRVPDRLELLLDIGTNCEMVLSDRGRKLAAAAAAGPAFEGGSSAVGCRARPGAVDHLAVSEAGYFRFHVIGGDLRRIDGICGSGLVDFLAGMRGAGLIDEFGRYNRARLGSLGRLEAGTPETGLLCRLSSQLAVSEADIEALLKAKAAIEAGVLALLGSVGRSPSELDALYLCGGFASALDLASARSTGLLPAVAADRIRICGNTSLAAAIQAAADPEILDQFESERPGFRDIPLNNLPEFEELYTRSLALN